MTDRDPAALELIPERVGKKHKITAKLGGEVVFIDTIDLASATGRDKVANMLHRRCPAVTPEMIDTELLKISTADAGERPKPEPAEHARGDPEVPPEVLADANAILEDPELIGRVCDDVAALGVAGERELALTVYLIGVSRLLPTPLAGIVRGSSTSGKSFIIERVSALFPPEAVIFATQMTPQALFHMPPGSLRHKWVVAGERSRLEDDDRAEATRALREMLSAGRLSKLMPMKGEGGRIETVAIEQEGPIAFIESTTLTQIFEEDANRCLLLQTDECEVQTRRILTELAGRHSAPRTGDHDRTRQIHHAIQRTLPSVEVRVPYADRIAERFDCNRVEVRRAFPQLLSLIQASALLHHRQRSTDSEGTLLANATDYQIARRLIAKPFALSLGGGVSDSARRFFQSLKKWANREFTSAEAKRKGSAGKSSVYGWLSELHEAGAIKLVEARRGRTPARWKLTGSEPEPTAAIIPPIEDIFPELDTARNHGHNTKLPEPQGV
jgi:hypothetical protein